MTTTNPPPTDETLRASLTRLGLYGLLTHFDELRQCEWLRQVIDYETTERQRRSLDRRLHCARLGSFKPLCDFDWKWPNKIDRATIEELCSLSFVREPANAVLLGPNGCGKTMIAKNLAHLAVQAGYSARFTTASELLNDLAAQDSASALHRRLEHYCRPALLVVDEIGYLSYDSRYADLLFEVVTRRAHKRALVITTNKPFAEWNQVFPNATSVVAIIDRLVHKAEIIAIEADSYRLKEAKERTAAKLKARKTPPAHKEKN